MTEDHHWQKAKEPMSPTNVVFIMYAVSQSMYKVLKTDLAGSDRGKTAFAE